MNPLSQEFANQIFQQSYNLLIPQALNLIKKMSTNKSCSKNDITIFKLQAEEYCFQFETPEERVCTSGIEKCLLQSVAMRLVA